MSSSEEARLPGRCLLQHGLLTLLPFSECCKKVCSRFCWCSTSPAGSTHDQPYLAIVPYLAIMPYLAIRVAVRSGCPPVVFLALRVLSLSGLIPSCQAINSPPGLITAKEVSWSVRQGHVFRKPSLLRFLGCARRALQAAQPEQAVCLGPEEGLPLSAASKRQRQRWMLQATFRGLISTLKITMQVTPGACRMQARVQAACLQPPQQHSLRPSHTARSSLAAPQLHRGLAGTARPVPAMHAVSPGTLCT